MQAALQTLIQIKFEVRHFVHLRDVRFGSKADIHDLSTNLSVEQGPEMMSRLPSRWLQIGHRQSSCACGGSGGLVHAHPRRLMASVGAARALRSQMR